MLQAQVFETLVAAERRGCVGKGEATPAFSFKMLDSIPDALATVLAAAITATSSYFAAKLAVAQTGAFASRRGAAEANPSGSSWLHKVFDRNLTSIAAIVSVAIVVMVSVVYNPLFGPWQKLVMSQTESGEYHRFLDEWSTLVDGKTDGRVFGSPVVSQGSVQTVDQLSLGEASIGIVQANSRPKDDQVKAISTLFDEYFMCLIPSNDWLAANGIKEPSPFSNGADRYTLLEAANAHYQESPSRRLRIATFGARSKTKEDLDSLIRLAGLTDKVDIVPRTNYEEAISLVKDTGAGRAHCAFFITGLGNRIVSTELRTGELSLASIGSSDALSLRMAGTRVAEIPEGFFGSNGRYRTLTTQAILACSASITSESAYQLADWVSMCRAQLAHEFLGFEGTDPRELATLPFDVHGGAARFFDGRELSFFERNRGIVIATMSSWALFILVCLFNSTVSLSRIVSLLRGDEEDDTEGSRLEPLPRRVSEPQGPPSNSARLAEGGVHREA